MRTLAIETTGTACSIALFEEEAVIAARHEIVGRGHAERLIPWIADLPGGGKADQILVGCGPGSFTGVRIGIAAARGLGLGWGVPVLGMSSLALLAATQNGPVTVAIEGGHGEMFVQDYMNAPLSPVDYSRSVTPQVAATTYSNDLIVGSAAELLVAARGSGNAITLHANAADALRLPLALRILPATPVYGRGADAKPMQ
jgi:tRNA threonylcarbamoyladenosine biosynthesis protein TsaB